MRVPFYRNILIDLQRAGDASGGPVFSVLPEKTAGYTKSLPRPLWGRRMRSEPCSCPGEAEQLPEGDEDLHGGADDENKAQVRDGDGDRQIDAGPG